MDSMDLVGGGDIDPMVSAVSDVAGSLPSLGEQAEAFIGLSLDASSAAELLPQAEPLIPPRNALGAATAQICTRIFKAPSQRKAGKALLTVRSIRQPRSDLGDALLDEPLHPSRRGPGLLRLEGPEGYPDNQCGSYRRLKKAWRGQSLAREFSARDVFLAALNHRVLTLKGATGTAKSKAMVAGLAQLESHLDQRHIVLGAYHRASLVHKGAVEFGVADLSAPHGSAERMGIHEGVIQRQGLFCCGEGAYKHTYERSLWDWYWELLEHPRPTVLILDEVSQVLANWTMGGTDALRRIRGKALQALEGLVQLQCVRVWAADALVGDCELEWLEAVSGSTPFLLKSTFTRPRILYLGQPTPANQRTLLLQLKDVIRSGERFWLGHGTVKGLRELMEALPVAEPGTELLITGGEDSRTDPRVARLMANTEAEGPQYLRIGFSPAVSCGISMAMTRVLLTAIVQEYCWRAEDVVQALNRARNCDLRMLLAPKVVRAALGITRETNARRAAQVLNERMRAGDLRDYVALLDDRHPATPGLVARLEARRNLECFCNESCLRGLLEDEGYELHDIQELESDFAPQDCPTSSSREPAARTLEGVKLYRLRALQRLALGVTTLEAEQREAKRLAKGGAFLDLAEIDVSEAWLLAQELHLDALIRVGKVHSTCPEIVAVWEALMSLDRPGVKRVERALDIRAERCRRTGQRFDVRTIWPLVKALGYEPKRAGQTRCQGKIWVLEPKQLA